MSGALNLDLEQGNNPTEPLTLGLEGIAIVPASDERVSAVRSWSKAADRFLGAFHDGTGDRIDPPVLPSPRPCARHGDAGPSC